MATRRSLLMLLLAGLLAASALSWAQEATEEQLQGIAVESDDRSDTALAQRLREIFRELSDFREVRVAVAAGVVTLTGQVVDAAAADEAARLAGRVEGVVTVRNEIVLDDSLGERLLPAFDRLESRARELYGLAPIFLVALLVAGLIVLLGFWVASLRGPWDRVAPNAFVADLIRQVLRLAFIAAALVVGLDILGATALLGTILGAAGIVGLAVGFALRDTIENYVASILLSVRQPFGPNDLVRIDDHEGYVIRLTSRATVLMTLDGNHVRIPNASVFKGVIVNYTRNPERRFEYTVGVAADCNLKEALGVGLRALESLDFVLREPEPLALVHEIGESNVVLWFAGWIDQRQTDHAKARGEAIRLTKRALEDAEFDMPEPIYRLRLDSWAAQTLPAPADRATAGDTSGEAVAGPVESPDVGDASKETAITEKVAVERSSESEQDLLDPAAPREM